MGIPGFVVEDETPDPVKAIDFTTEPFDRGDKYIVDIYFTYEKSPGRIGLSSPHSAQLILASEVSRESAIAPNQMALIWSLVFCTVLEMNY